MLAVFGAALWALSAAGFVELARGHDLGVLAMVTSALGLLAANVVGVLVFGEAITLRKCVAFGLLIAALAVLVWPNDS